VAPLRRCRACRARSLARGTHHDDDVAATTAADHHDDDAGARADYDEHDDDVGARDDHDDVAATTSSAYDDVTAGVLDRGGL
jgi:hypothetical protein